MAENNDVDLELKELQKIGAENRSDINELLTAVMGPPPSRNNGLRGDMKQIKKTIEDLKTYITKLWTVERPKSCVGMKALEDYKARIDPIIEKVKAAESQEITAKAQKDVATINLKGVYFVAITTLIATLLQLVFDFIKK